MFTRANVLQCLNPLHERLVMSNIQQDRRRFAMMRYDDGAFCLADLSDTGCYPGSKLGEWLYVFGEL